MDGNQPQAPDVPPRRLYREPEEKKLTGLCGGIADYVGVDPTVVRLAAVIIVLVTPVTFVAYLIAAVVVPVRPATVPRQRAGHKALGDVTPHLLGLLALALFVGLVDREWWFDFEAPIVGMGLLGLGVWLLLSNRREPAPPSTADERTEIPRENLATSSDEATTLHGEVEPERALVGPPASESTSGTTLHKTEDGTPPAPVPLDPASSVPDDSAHSAGPQGEVPPPVPPWGLGTPPAGGSPGSFDWFGTSEPSPPSGSTTTVVVDQPSPPRRERSRLPVAVIGLLLVAAGSTALLAMLGVVDVDAGFALAAVLVAIGVGLIVGTWWGRARSLVVLGVPIAGLLLFSDAADLPIDAGSGDRTIVVDQDRELDDVHELLAGKLRLDLRDMPAPSPRDGVPTIRAEVAVGHLEVLLPADVTADVRTLIQAGDVDSPGLDGGSEDGGRFRRHFVVDGREGGERVRLDLKMGLGKIEVRHA